MLEPFIPYLVERWNAGRRNGTTLWKEIVERGYSGKRVNVFSFITRLRKALGIPAKNRTSQNGKVAVPEERPLTPRSAVWQVLERLEKRDEATDKRLEQLLLRGAGALVPFRRTDEVTLHYVRDIPERPRPYIAHPF